MVNFVKNLSEDFGGGGGSVDEGKVKIFGDFGVGGVDFLLEFVGFLLEGFFSFTTTSLAFVTDFIGNR